MLCDNQFAAFDDLIKLDKIRRGRLDSAFSAFTTFCENDDQLRAASAGSPFLQGSIATSTAVRPIHDNEFDVDVIYPFNLSAFDAGITPLRILKWFMSRLKQNAFYKGKLIPKDRCARVDYAGDFHMDIIPSTRELPDHQPYAVAARDLSAWKTNSPIELANWVRRHDQAGGGLNSDGDGFFVRSVRIMKRWRDTFLDEDSAPSSMLLVTFLGNHDPMGGHSCPN